MGRRDRNRGGSCCWTQITNPFTYMLHNDALGLLVCAVAFGALVGYAETRQPGWLVVLAFVPATGFMVKQSLGIWGTTRNRLPPRL